MSKPTPSRRQIVGTLGVGVAAASLPVAAVASEGTAVPHQPDVRRAWAQGQATAALDGPWWLIAPHGPGESLGQGWVLADFTSIERGAAVLTLVHGDGDARQLARVHVCTHDGAPRGLAHTALLDFILMDGGDGGRMTDEGLGRVLLGLAQVVRINELDDAGDLRELAWLQTHDERVVRYGPDTLT